MANIINGRGNTEYVDDAFARGLALELIERCNATMARAEQWGGQVSDSDAQRAQDDYHEAHRLLREIGELGNDGASAGDVEAEKESALAELRRAQVQRIAEVYKQLAPAPDSGTPAHDSESLDQPIATSETESVTVRAIPGSGGYYFVLGKGGPAQFATHTAAEAEARRRVGSRP